MSNLRDVIQRANTDRRFRSQLKADPAAACEEAGVEVLKQAKFKVIERGRNELHLVLGGRTNIAELDRILESAEQDTAFKEQLLSDPRSAIEAATGQSLPDKCTVHVHEVDPNEIYLFLDDLPSAEGELPESNLTAVAGGVVGGIVPGGAITSAAVGFIPGLNPVVTSIQGTAIKNYTLKL